MLSVMCGVFAMTPITFGIAGYVLVSREGSPPNPTVTPAASSIDRLARQRC